MSTPVEQEKEEEKQEEEEPVTTTTTTTTSSNNNNDQKNETKKKKPTLAYSENPPLPENAPHWAMAAHERLQMKWKIASETGQSLFGVVPPPGVEKVLLHSCCAPCSGAMVEEMTSNSSSLQNVTVFFYNPNIHPRKEYEIRKEENKSYCEKLGIDFVDADYDVENWYKRVKGMEFDPERGRRCTECFDMRMERTALYAYEHGFDAISTTNATSRWKDENQVDASGERAVARYNNNNNNNNDADEKKKKLIYWKYNWKTDEMTLRKYQISADYKFYKQEYCGCSYSLRDSNEWRKANGIPKIEIGGETAGLGNRYFSNAIEDAEEENQDVVDEFFAQAIEIAQAGNDRTARKKKLEIYKDRRRSEANDGIVNGLNNW